MKAKALSVLVLLAVAMVVPMVLAGKPWDGTTIQDGILEYSAGHYLEGEPLKVGYDIFGYNYQGHMFNGYYCNAYLGREGLPPYEGDTEAYLAENPEAATKWYWPYRDVFLMMKWSDVWLSNKDRNDDGMLDRGNEEPYTSSAAEGAWLTNHQRGTYEEDGKVYSWNYYVKIITPSEEGDYKSDGYWYNAEHEQIGPVIWGAYAIVLQIYNDQGTGEHGVEYKSEVSPGFGYYN